MIILGTFMSSLDKIPFNQIVEINAIYERDFQNNTSSNEQKYIIPYIVATKLIISERMKPEMQVKSKQSKQRGTIEKIYI